MPELPLPPRKPDPPGRPLPPDQPKRPPLGDRLQARASKRRNRAPLPSQEELQDPRGQAGAEELSALASADLAESSSADPNGPPLQIPRSYLNALLNI